VPEAVIPPPPPPPPPPPEAPTRACEECGAALDERQEVCVECGHAAPPLERRRLRGALPTASLAAAAVLLAASAAYGLSAGGASNVRDIGVGPKPPGGDTIAQATPTPPPATTSPTPDTVPQATPTPPPASSTSTPAKTPKAAKKAKTPTSTTPSTSSTNTNSSGGTSSPGGTTTHHHHHSNPPAHHATPPPSWLADGDPPYDEFNYGGGSRPKKANDGNTKTFWTGSTGSGLVVDTGKAAPYGFVGIATSTPGYKVTVYSSEDNKGSGNPSANGWKRVGGGSVAKYQKVPVKLPNDPPRYLLIYVSGSSVAINEVRLLLD
jgi:hypothetical protein